MNVQIELFTKAGHYLASAPDEGVTEGQLATWERGMADTLADQEHGTFTVRSEMGVHIVPSREVVLVQLKVLKEG